MEKEDRLSDLISGKTDEACMNCAYFKFDNEDPQGVGGNCAKDGEFGFCFEYCKNYIVLNDWLESIQNENDDSVVVSDYKCPICGGRIVQIQSQFATSSVSCENDCFEKQEMIYPECPVCKKGKMSKPHYHGTMYVKCDNKSCGFEMSPQALITWVIKNKG